MLGVLGGMGPLATADFFIKLVAATPANDDADHVPVLILSDPRVPPRPPAILGDGESPLPAMLARRDQLIKAGATVLAMPCNTAHFWFDELTTDCPVPFISIVEAACAEVAARAAPGDAVGLIATGATLAAHLYDSRLAAQGYQPKLPDTDTMTNIVLPAIRCVKQGDAAQGGRMLEPVVRRLREEGATVVLLACTETPLALDAIGSALREHCIDTTAALARACVAFWRAR
ncbi:MAG: amino acid racemase [Burkholderiales bacterium]|nr:amino acid racemase [Burkholderiales bacterium]